MSTALQETTENQGEIYHGFQANLKPAPLVKRFLASCVDYGILGALFYVLVIAAIAIGVFIMAALSGIKDSLIGQILMISAIAVLVVGLLSVYHIYFIYFEYKKGRTPGKKLFGLSVMTIDGSPRTKSKMIIRELFRYVDTLVFPAVICIAMTDRKQRVGDLMAGTFVAYSQTQEAGSNFIYIKQADYNYISELVQPKPVIDSKFMDDFLLYASQRFLKGISEFDMNDPYMLSLEQQVREYFDSENHQRLDGRSALLFFAEHCYQLDLKKRLEEKG